MNLPDFKRLIRPMANKIFLLLGRAILKAVTNSGDRQLIQVTGLKGEIITGVERFQEYGLETYPLVDAEAFIGFLNGNRDHGIACVIHDGRYRPTDLSSGEVALYTSEDSGGSHRIHLKAGTGIDIIGSIIQISGSDVSIGDITGTLRKLIDERFVDVFNTHKHSDPGNVPLTPIAVDTHTTIITKAN